MMKVFYIACLFLIASGKSFAQVSHASVSATIVTSVGAEFPGEISNVEITGKSTGKETGVIRKKENTTSFLKIIGNEFSHNTTVEKDLTLQRKDLEEELPVSKQQSFIRITVNFD